MPDAVQPGSFRALCLTEAVRLRETDTGALDDASAIRWARTRGTSNLNTLIQLRALFLARTGQLDRSLDSGLAIARWTFSGLMLLALVAGVSTAIAALGDGTRTVNLFMALTVMLGVHTASLLAWLTTLAASHKTAGSRLGHLWLWLSKKLARRPHTGLLVSAATMVLARQRCLRWVFAAVSHALWVAAFVGLLAALLVLLSARSYSFMWETTLLTSDVFVRLTSVIGWLPSQLGFAVPSPDTVLASSASHAPLPTAQPVWSSWLLGAVVVYGLLPRVLALAISLALVLYRLRTSQANMQLAGSGQLRARLQPASSDTDARPGIETAGLRQYHQAAGSRTDTSTALIAGLELGARAGWPPAPLTGAQTEDAGIIDSLAQRNALLDRLAAYPVERLLLVCDGQQTPDRGLLHLILDLAQYARHTRVAFCLPAAQTSEPGTEAVPGMASDTPHPAWASRLAACGFEPGQIHNNILDALSWLEAGHEPNPLA